jgi:hypothetical protein
MATLTKHLAGTEFDHDQQRHAGGASADDARARWSLENKRTVKVDIEDWLGFFGMTLHDAGAEADYDETPQDLYEQASELATKEIIDTLDHYFQTADDALDEFSEFGASVLRVYMSYGEGDYFLRDDTPPDVREWVEAYLEGQDGESASPLDNLYTNDVEATARFGFEVFQGQIDARLTETPTNFDNAKEKLSTDLFDVLESNETVWSVTETYLTELYDSPDYVERSLVSSLDRAEAKRGVQAIVAEGLKEFSGRELLAVHVFGRFVESSALTTCWTTLPK